MIDELGCGKYPCPCTHTHPCDRGWIWLTWTDIRETTLPDGTIKQHKTEYDGVRHCPICRPERAAQLQAGIKGSGKPQIDEPKTRIL